MTDRREYLRDRYRSLGFGELAAAVVFAGVAAFVVAPRMDGSDRAALCAALIPLLAILVQAGCYWLAARSWVGAAPMPRGLSRIYRAFRITDLVLLSAGLAGVVAWWPAHPGVASLVLAVWLFGVIEWINYFHIRLAYPARRWFSLVGERRTPRLLRDIRSGDTAHTP
jgi:hypothetical protein